MRIKALFVISQHGNLAQLTVSLHRNNAWLFNLLLMFTRHSDKLVTSTHSPLLLISFYFFLKLPEFDQIGHAHLFGFLGSNLGPEVLLGVAQLLVK